MAQLTRRQAAEILNMDPDDIDILIERDALNARLDLDDVLAFKARRRAALDELTALDLP